MTFEVEIRGARRSVEVRREGDRWRVEVDGQPLEADLAWVNGHTLSLLIAGRSRTLAWAGAGGGQYWFGGRNAEAWATVADPRRASGRRDFELAGRVPVRAAMAGKVVRVLSAAGDRVESGQPLLVLEAMKMQNEVRSPKAGVVAALSAAAGDTVATGQLLAEIE